MIRKTIFILSLIFVLRSFAQSDKDTLVLENKYSKGTVSLKSSDSGIMNKFILIDRETKKPVSGIVAIYGKRGVSYYIADNGFPKQAIMKNKNIILYELTTDNVYFIETYKNNNLKHVYTVIKSENQMNFYQYQINKNHISLKHSYPINGKLKTEKFKITEIPLSHRLPMNQFKLNK